MSQEKILKWKIFDALQFRKIRKMARAPEGCQFLRRLPNMMIAPDSSKIVHSFAGLLDPDKSTDKELVYIKMSGNYHVHYR